MVTRMRFEEIDNFVLDKIILPCRIIINVIYAHNYVYLMLYRLYSGDDVI